MLLDDLARLSNDQLEALLARLTPESAQGALVALQVEMRERCARDGLWFLKFVRTRDEADPDASDKPFPLHEPYVEPVWRTLETKQRVIVAKSRQMLMSWIMCAFAVWWARFKPNQAVYWQTQKAEDAYEKIALPTGGGTGGYQGRCQFIENHLPAFLRLPVRPSEGRLQYPNGSLIQAIPGGADQIRGKVASVIIEDEYAFQAEAAGVWTACAPLVQKAAKFIAVSTPNGSANQFARLWHGEM